MAISQIKKQPGNYTDFRYKEGINLKRNKRETWTSVAWGKDPRVETEKQPKPGLARTEVAQPAWSPLPRPYRAASPSTPRGEQPASGLTVLGTTCRNPHLSGHILTCRVFLHQVDWQIVASSTDTHPRQEVCASRGTCTARGGGSCVLATHWYWVWMGWWGVTYMYNCAGWGEN